MQNGFSETEFKKSLGQETLIIGGPNKNLPYRGVLKQAGAGYILENVSGIEGLSYEIRDGDQWSRNGKTLVIKL